MGRIRTIAALLAIISAASAVFLARLALEETAVLLLVGAALLALAAPFPAPAPPARKRVALACLLYTLIVAGTALWAYADAQGQRYAALVAGQAVVGAVLTAQAYRTRNRRQHQAGLRAYFSE